MNPLTHQVLEYIQKPDGNDLKEVIFGVRTLYHQYYNPGNAPSFNYPPGYDSIRVFTRLIQEQRAKREQEIAAAAAQSTSGSKVRRLFLFPSYLLDASFSSRPRRLRLPRRPTRKSQLSLTFPTQRTAPQSVSRPLKKLTLTRYSIYSSLILSTPLLIKLSTGFPRCWLTRTSRKLTPRRAKVLSAPLRREDSL